MTVFISGGCKNGKSTFAQKAARALAGGGKMWYVATMIPHDAEDEARIRRHLREREGWGFETAEQGRDILSCLERTGAAGAFLLDSVTALLANEMFSGADFRPDAGKKVAEELLAFAERAEHAVFVSDFIFGDAGRYDEYTETYRRALAETDRALARRCDCVFELCGGSLAVHKGEVFF